MLYVKEEMLSVAGIGQNWIFHCTDGCAYQGILCAISQENLTYSTLDGQSVSLEWNRIYTAEPVVPQSQKEMERTCAQWWKQKENIVAGVQFRQIFSLTHRYHALFDKLSEYDTHPVLQDILSAKNQRMRKRLYLRDREEMQTCLSELDRLLRLYGAEVEEHAAARSLVYLVGRDYISALGELLPRAISSEPEAGVMLPLACFYNEIRDGAGTFYWLIRYFDHKSELIREDNDLWWGYLKYALAFDYFPEVWKQIEGIYEAKPTLALRSIAFSFFLRGDYHKGTLLYNASCQDSPAIPLEALRTFYAVLTYNTTAEDWGSYFYRYYLRASQIIKDGAYRTYYGDENFEGYVYDFVEARGYCLVLGLDLITYFLHFDNGAREGDNFTPAIRRKLRQEMNGLHSISDETPVRVYFHRDSEIGPGKRTYYITHATLDTPPG